MPLVYFNGDFLDLDSVKISVEDRGFQFADGVYEVVRIYGGKPFRLKQHFERLKRSAAGIELEIPARLEQACLRLLKREPLPEAALYIQITRGVSPRKHSWPSLKPTVLAYLRQRRPADSTGCRAISLPDERWGRCHLKTIALLPNVLAASQATRAGCAEAIFVRAGVVTEGSSSNVFLVRSGSVLTHPADNRILAGITRAVLKEIAGIREEKFSLAQAYGADEIFLSSTTDEVVGVLQIDGKTIGKGVPGPMTLRLAEAYRRVWRQECLG